VEPTDRLAALLIGLFNIALAPQRKKMSAALNARLRTALHDAVSPGDPIYDLLDELLDEVPRPPPRPVNEYATVSFEATPDFERWKKQRSER
jgi:hypothetical protein